MMALVILGWPVNTLAADVACKVLRGGCDACRDFHQAVVTLFRHNHVFCVAPVNDCMGCIIDNAVQNRFEIFLFLCRKPNLFYFVIFLYLIKYEYD